jgi:hypothetical protein
VGVFRTVGVVYDILSTVNYTFNRYAAISIRNNAAVAAINVQYYWMGELGNTKSYS